MVGILAALIWLEPFWAVMAILGSLYPLAHLLYHRLRR
jgi:hypothetical protein